MKPVSRPRVFALAILVLAIALRLWDLTARSLWLDEAVEYWVATASLASLPATVRAIIQDPPFYSALLHLWMQVSNHEVWLRLLSVCFGVGSVLGAMVAGYRLQGRAAALAAGFLMSILPVAVRYSQEVGQYAPMLFFVVWSLVALLSVVREPGWKQFMGWVALAVAGAYTYYGTVIPVLVPFACVVVEAIARRDGIRVRRGLASLAIFFVAMLPLLVYFLPHQLHRGPTADAFKMAAIAPAGEMLRDAGSSLQTTFGFQFSGWPCTPVPGWATVALFVIVAALACRTQRRFVIWFVVTWLVYSGLGWLHLFPIGFRHSNILTALIVPLAACAIPADGTFKRRMAPAVGFVMLCALCIASLPTRTLRDRLNNDAPCTWPETEDIGRVAKYWTERRTPGQKTYVYYGAAPAFAYYADRLGIGHASRPPDWFQYCWRGEGAAWCGGDDVYYGEWLRPLDPEQKIASIVETLDGMPDEFWFVFAHAQEGENVTIGKHLLQHYDSIDYLTLTDASAVLLKRRAP